MSSDAASRDASSSLVGPSDASAIRVANLSKCFQIYGRPEDRLKQSILPRVQRLLGRPESRHYREFWALHDISLDVRKGGTLGVIGRNGSGKSTLLQIICGTLTPTSGTVEVNGRVAALLELGSGFNPEFTGRENIYMSGAVLGLSREEVDARYDDIVAFAEIGDFIEQPIKTYSSGMYLRLAFAVIAHADAEILVIDEALAVGDAVFTQKCMRFLRTFMRNGTLLFVSHDVGSVLNLCESAVWLDKGIIRMYGNAREITDAYNRECMQIAVGESIRIETVGVDKTNPEWVVSPTLDPAVQVSFFDNIVNSEGWTTNLAKLVSVGITDGNGQVYASFVGGEHIELKVTAIAYSPLHSPIIGFLVKDRLGQALFGENTFDAAGAVPAASGQSITARFVFSLPMLSNGDYTMTVAIADGTPEVHVQHHWLHDAIVIRVSTKRPGHGLVGIPFKKVSLKVD